MDAEKARRNVEKFKTDGYKNFLKKNKERLSKLLIMIDKLSSEGKREYQLIVPNKEEIPDVSRYIASLGFNSCVLKHVDFKVEGRIKEILRITW